MNSEEITFITGNQHKADKLAQYLDLPIKHTRLDLDEIQSLDLGEIVEHKVRQAYGIIQGPVLVEDVSLEFKALGGLPGPFIKFFVDNMPFEDICQLPLNNTREATAKCMFGYYDGETLKMFLGSHRGEIANEPAGENGFAWDKFFIPDGYQITRAQMNEDDYKKTYLQIKPFEKLKNFIETL